MAEQFLTETGLVGTSLAGLATDLYALTQHWSVQIPLPALYGRAGGALAIGAVAGLYPAFRAARLPPAEALRTAEGRMGAGTPR